ncbi:hypothetical protein [Burkholderia sp. Ac-20353]|uniref:hypothetical protein n=1 Tax=Burkholderia sp. Ac-20353 TaxID=2703894 RepID=UPI00197B3ED4|nr:hypothetical protein [Burkholderia sp. Ac-20353]MBN3792229.1 hypothetical protein [Burkholderia sp. Ac-20353]
MKTSGVRVSFDLMLLVNRVVALACVGVLALPSVSHADVGVMEPVWSRPPRVYELPHQLSVPRIEQVRDTVKIGNFDVDGATVDIVLVGNGERLLGGSGNARRIHSGLYELSADHPDHCALKLYVEPRRIGIKGTQGDAADDRFCPIETIWIPIKK